MQAKGDEQRPGGRVGPVPATESDPSELCKGDGHLLGDAGEGHGRRSAVLVESLAVADLRQPPVLDARDRLVFPQSPVSGVIGIEGDTVHTPQVQRVPLESQEPGVGRRRVPSDDLGNPSARVLGVRALLSEMDCQKP